MRPQEKRLNDLVMSTIDHAYHNTRGLNLPEHLHDRFLEEFKHQFYTYIIDNSAISAITRIYSMASRVSTATFEEDINHAIGNNPMINEEFTQIAEIAMEQALTPDEDEAHRRYIYRFV